jgi:hypothetical protein
LKLIVRDYDLTSFGRDPQGRTLQSLNEPFGFFLFPLSSFRKQAFFGTSVKQITPLPRGSFKLCGERGIRTPGTLLRYTRFPGVPVKPLLHLSFIIAYGLKNRGAKYKNIFIKRPVKRFLPRARYLKTGLLFLLKNTFRADA